MSKKSVEQLQESFEGFLKQLSQELKFSNPLGKEIITYLSDLHKTKVADAKGRYWGHYSDKIDFLNSINQRLSDSNLEVIFQEINKSSHNLDNPAREDIKKAIKNYLNCIFTQNDEEFRELGKLHEPIIIAIFTSMFKARHEEWLKEKKPIEEKWEKLCVVASIAETKQFEDLTKEFNGDGDRDRLARAGELIKDLQRKKLEIDSYIKNLKSFSEKIKESKALISEADDSDSKAISSLKKVVNRYDDFENIDENSTRETLVEEDCHVIMEKNRELGSFRREINEINKEYAAEQAKQQAIRDAEQAEKVRQDLLLKAKKPAEVSRNSVSEVKGKKANDKEVSQKQDYKQMAELVKNRIETYQTKLYIINIGCFSIKSSSVDLKISVLEQVLKLINSNGSIEVIKNQLKTWETEAYGRLFRVTKNDKNFHENFTAALTISK